AVQDEPVLGAQRAVLTSHNGELIAGQAVVGPVGAEHLAYDPELEGREPIKDDERYFFEHIIHHAPSLAGCHGHMALLPLAVQPGAGLAGSMSFDRPGARSDYVGAPGR